MEVPKDKEGKKSLKVSTDYIGYDWTISCGYYAMFHAATAELAAIGIKAQSHESLIEGLEYHFVLKEKAIESKDIEKTNLQKDLMKNMLIECGLLNPKEIRHSTKPIQLLLKRMQKKFIRTQ